MMRTFHLCILAVVIVTVSTDDLYIGNEDCKDFTNYDELCKRIGTNITEIIRKCIIHKDYFFTKEDFVPNNCLDLDILDHNGSFDLGDCCEHKEDKLDNSECGKKRLLKVCPLLKEKIESAYPKVEKTPPKKDSPT